ncbi:unnamed protein product [Linum tenue]|uniref:Uncharacterized protein n=1 Tax=Linum tenue TaxID=586396 RepID=A0AAV0HZ74_9ROSI|nr:unnamed protein product [Linum tenue]
MKKNVLEFNASIVDRFDELFGRGVSLQLISSVHGDPRKFPFFIKPIELGMEMVVEFHSYQMWDESRFCPKNKYYIFFIFW